MINTLCTDNYNKTNFITVAKGMNRGEMPLNKRLLTAHLCPIMYNSYIPLSQIRDTEIYDPSKTEKWT